MHNTVLPAICLVLSNSKIWSGAILPIYGYQLVLGSMFFINSILYSTSF